jgi:AcrR family transcriptional regulator
VSASCILDAAQQVFSTKGSQGASLRAIAQKAGCDPALIYHLFKNKEDLFLALLDRKLGPLSEDLKRIADPADLRPTVLRLWDVLAAYRHYFRTDMGSRAVLRGEILRGTEWSRGAIAERLKVPASCLWAILEQGKARREVRVCLDPQLGGLFFVKLYLEILEGNPQLAQEMTGMDPSQGLHQIERAWMDIYWRGIALYPWAPIPTLPGSKESF